MDSLVRLQGLHEGLIALTNARLVNIDRLWQQLEASLQEFRDLLDVSLPQTDPPISVANGCLSRSIDVRC